MEEATRLVSQRKISQAIKHYLAISDHDPSDLSLLNTIGDLCIRDGNTAEAIKQFQKLADAYTQEGFLLKAVAIRKKISKLAPSDVEPLLKLAEHYSTLGLGREAREHYLQAVALCEKQALTHKALDILRKLVKQEPENLAYRVRLGESCVAVGQNGPAALIYAEIAEIAYKRGELAAVDQPLQRARQLDPSNVQATLLSVRLALDSHQADRAKDILQSSSALKSNPEAVRLLLDVHLLEGKFDDATRVVTRAFREGNDSVGILMHYVQACLSASGPDAALKPLREIAAEAFERNLVETIRHPLRLISEKYPDHLPTLELLVQIAERIPGGEDLLKAVELLSNAYVRASRKDQAENLYRQLLSRDPENNLWQARLNGILQTGMEPQEATSTEAPQPEMTKPEEEPENPHVEEALENASIFARYGLIDKALDELDRALQSEPENFKLLRQTFEVSKQDRPGRAAQAAEAIAALLRKRGDLEAAAEFEELRREVQASAAAELPSQSTSSSQPGGVPPHLDSPAGPTEERFDLEGQPAVMGITPQIRSAPPGPQIVSSIPVSSSASSRTSVSQIDLTEEVEALASITAGQVEEEIIAAPDVFAEERAEIDFYLEYGFFVEARQAAGALAEKFPTHPGLADLQKRVDEATQSIPLTPEETVEPGAGASPAAASEEDLAAVLPAQDAAQDLTEEPQLTPEVPIVEGPAFAITPVPGEPVGEAEPEFAQEPGNWISGRFEESQPDAAEIVVAEEPAHPLDFEWSSMEAISAEEPAQVAEPVPSEPTLVEEVLVAHEIVSRAPAPPPVEEFPPAPDVIAAVPEPSPVEEPLPTAEAVPSIAEPPPVEELRSRPELTSEPVPKPVPPAPALGAESLPAPEIVPSGPAPPAVEELPPASEFVSTVSAPPVAEPSPPAELTPHAVQLEEPPPASPLTSPIAADQTPQTIGDTQLAPAAAISDRELSRATEPEPNLIEEFPTPELPQLSQQSPEPEPVPAQETTTVPPVQQQGTPPPPVHLPEAPVEVLPETPVDLFPDLQAFLIDSTKEGHEQAAGPVETGPPAVKEQSGEQRRPVPHRPAASFNQILQELSGDLVIAESPDSPEKHYNLGLAFREMDLIDEAIGEFQKVVRGSVKGNLPPRFLEACSLLASCFMQKGMPSIAVKWYQRALDVPGVEGDALLALNYDLADAMDRAGQKKPALEKFMEVYSENIDYRDVADRIRALQHSLA